MHKSNNKPNFNIYSFHKRLIRMQDEFYLYYQWKLNIR